MTKRCDARLAGVAVVGLLGSACGAADTEVLQELASPDSAFVARAYVRSGGGAAGWVALLVNVDRRGEPFQPGKDQVMVMGRPYLVRLSWTSPRQLLVEYPPNADFGGRRTVLRRKEDVVITYSPTYRPDSAAAASVAGAP